MKSCLNRNQVFVARVFWLILFSLNVMGAEASLNNDGSGVSPDQAPGLAGVAEVAGVAGVDSQSVEIPVFKVYVSSDGYDDNDLVEFVVDGELSNGCWTLDQTIVSIDSVKKNSIRVRQMAKKKSLSHCKDDESLPQEFIQPVPFITSVRMDNPLPHGNYSVEFLTKTDLKNRPLAIDQAPTDEIDSLPYAITTKLQVPSVIEANSGTFDVLMKGTLSNLCTELNERVPYLKFDDVFILLPEVTKSLGSCPPIAKSFELRVKLMTPTPGRYLIQVRRVNGQSVNALFTVK